MIPYHEIYKSPNHWSSRRGYKIVAAGVHITGGEFESNHAWIMNPNANASYNCLIKRDGTRVNYVPEDYPAHSHGAVNKGTWPLLKEYPGVNPNWYTLSVSRVGSNQNLWTPEQLKSTVEILRYWSEKYGFPLRRPYIFGHFEIDSVNRWYCPGKPFFDALIAELSKDEEGAEEDMLKTAIVVNSLADVLTVEPLAKKMDAPIFLREACGQLNAETVIVAGGDAKIFERPGAEVVDLRGTDRWETAAKVGEYYKGLK